MARWGPGPPHACSGQGLRVGVQVPAAVLGGLRAEPGGARHSPASAAIPAVVSSLGKAAAEVYLRVLYAG